MAISRDGDGAFDKEVQDVSEVGQGCTGASANTCNAIRSLCLGIQRHGSHVVMQNANIFALQFQRDMKECFRMVEDLFSVGSMLQHRYVRLFSAQECDQDILEQFLLIDFSVLRSVKLTKSIPPPGASVSHQLDQNADQNVVSQPSKIEEGEVFAAQ